MPSPSWRKTLGGRRLSGRAGATPLCKDSDRNQNQERLGILPLVPRISGKTKPIVSH